ncbi:MAG TPA: UrcA family protein [Allosphingosinicella sp.]|nr:UrcA family protein [Allosphingosinicella sp.]
MFKRNLAALAAAAVTAAGIAIATPASAEPSEDSVAVSYGDLDLSTANGSARFDRRVRNAARTLCGWNQLQPIDMQRQVSACQEAAIANAKADARVAMAKNGGPFRLALRAD